MVHIQKQMDSHAGGQCVPGETVAQLPKVSGVERVTSRLTWMGPQLQRLSHVNCVSGVGCVCVCVCVSHSVVSDSL